MKKIIQLIGLGAAVLFVSACGKDFLDKRADKALLVPQNISDFQAMLDNYPLMNTTPIQGEIASDDNYTTEAGYLGLTSQTEKSAYTWSKEPVPGFIGDWTNMYIHVKYANIVLEGLEKIEQTPQNQLEYNLAKGTALFFRAQSFYEMAQIFAEPYVEAKADKTPGIPLVMVSDVNVREGRGTLRQTYDRVIADLTDAAGVLPVTVPVKSRPCKGAALALLARTYLTMGNYEKALSFATSCLALQSKLIDYSTLNAASTRPFPAVLPYANDEVLYYSCFLSYSFTANTTTMVDSTLYRSYNSNDLRKVIFFNDRGKGVITFKGAYSGSGFSNHFTGMTTDEVYLVRSECYARKGDAVNALADLNTLLVTRFKKGTYVPYTASTAEAALNIILTERRKQLLFRGLRWTDLRRLNLELSRAITLKRILGTQTYMLPPNDPRYVFLIPQDELAGNSIAQNPR
ncbi:RagB/SusD family nutrient uptake outer membrane protein [Hufsiella ginkgonis]|uniref:RagB/SusD family nutrient uptake outer membrane protein n=1 Tax=Hufsiella ginkgonis TaxID=2695274 RepID=A0A7K1XZ26_9SPHI|nr:RagB/SusD family nutrient uptake outer membrane protein [Hufsiella ginkgonis]MXV16078.1 RagB/SusD family nutrient uptake outer membrane protein [Hufsiella ginkgonis]